MACPMGYGVTFQGGDQPLPPPHFDEKDLDLDPAQNGVNKVQMYNGMTYGDYLQLDKLLNCQTMKSANDKKPVQDEHLFIIIHQAYELWFKQIIFDIDHVRTLLDNSIVDETKTLQIVSLLERTVRILRLLADQILILETMSPLDFVEFRKYLTTSSGFQSLQFRLLENKLGVHNDNRVKYNAQNYREAFNKTEDMNEVMLSEIEPSLFQLIERWLERTPGVMTDPEEDDELAGLCNDVDLVTLNKQNGEEAAPVEDAEDALKTVETAQTVDAGMAKINAAINGESKRKTKPKGFWPNFVDAINNFLEDMRLESEEEGLTEPQRKQALSEYEKTKMTFGTIISEVEHNKCIKKQERRLSHAALKGALMIYFYREMPRFSQPYQILTFLMDIDSLLQKWRYNHVMLVQRMLGSKQGTGGSSGYLYLRTTVSDRYKVFLDLFNLSTWLIPRKYIPALSPRMVRTLSHHANMNIRYG
uniref:Tryptophan 2,3-dioxygenase n=1 Tax=Panagrellus redivivus TaxID=6233 RepID=A0A7E4UMH5_PANRE